MKGKEQLKNIWWFATNLHNRADSLCRVSTSAHHTLYLFGTKKNNFFSFVLALDTVHRKIEFKIETLNYISWFPSTYPMCGHKCLFYYSNGEKKTVMRSSSRSSSNSSRSIRHVLRMTNGTEWNKKYRNEKLCIRHLRDDFSLSTSIPLGPSGKIYSHSHTQTNTRPLYFRFDCWFAVVLLYSCYCHCLHFV